jgi:regulator of protease activity HflC (stomatin/prohibitin superfamily)
MLPVTLALVAFAFILAAKGLLVVQQASVAVVERLGRYSRTLEPGLHFIVPFIDSVRPIMLEGRMRRFIELREQVMDFPPQGVITKDNVALQVDSVIFFQVTIPQKAVYEVENITLAIRQMAITTMRNIMGELQLDETLASRDTVNTRLRTILDDATDKWGVKVTRVELKNIVPPREIEEAMAKQMKAERERRAVVTEAEGVKTAQLLRAQGERDSSIAEAEGSRQSQILRAQGEAEAMRLVAIARAEATATVYKAIIETHPTDQLIALRYIEALEDLAKGPNKVFVPYQAVGVLGGAGAVKDLLGIK